VPEGEKCTSHKEKKGGKGRGEGGKKERDGTCAPPLTYRSGTIRKKPPFSKKGKGKKKERKRERKKSEFLPYVP